MTRFFFVLGFSCLLFGLAAAAEDAPYRPEPGKFPALEKAHAYRGELVFVDNANRRGSIRVKGSGMFFRNDPHPFAMLPYGIVRYHGAPAERSSTAAAYALAAAGRVFSETHQLSGAIGFTREHDLHVWTMRLRALCLELGGATAHRRAVTEARWGATR